MKQVLFFVLLILFISKSQAQQFSEKFSPVFAGMPGIAMAEHTDGNYLLFGAVDYYQGEPSGSLFKVDGNGDQVVGFESVHTDEPIVQAVVLASGKIIVRGSFHYLNGADVGKVALLNVDGSLDANFHVDPTLNIRSIAAQSTGKILAVTDSKLVRLNADGSVDDTFASNNFSQGISGVTMAQGDGFYMTNYANIYRYNANGQPDMTFSASGFSVLGSVVLQSDGKPVFLTRTYSSGPPYVGTFTVTRLLTSGALDPSFTAASISNTDGDVSDLLHQVLVRKNGQIALAGSFDSFGSQAGTIVELNPDGSPSRALLAVTTPNPFSMIEDSQGNIFAMGYIYLTTEPGIKHIVKITPDAQVDPSFSPSVSAVGFNGSQYSLEAQPSGKVVLGDYYYPEGLKNMPGPLVRLLPTGDVDPSFVPTIINFGSQDVSALLVQDDDKIVVAGDNLFVFTSSPNFGRLNPDGGFDDSFQTGTGFTQSGYGTSPRYIRSKNNKLYLAGFFDAYNGQKCQGFVVLNADGTLAVTPNSQLTASAYIQDLEVQSSGKALLLGTFSLPGGQQRKVIRLNPDGTLDNTFDLVVAGNAEDIEIDSHDNIWVAGSAFGSGILLRFLPDGQPDNTLQQGAGFAKTPGYTSTDECSGFFVKSIGYDRFVVGGSFMTYDGHPAGGIAMMDSNGEFIAIAGGNLDPVSVAYNGWYTNNTFYIAGRLSKNRGQDIAAFTSIVLPLEDATAPLSIAVKSTSAMDLSWQNRVRGADKIIVERSDADDLHYKIVDTIDAGVLAYHATDLEESTPYYFKVYGANEFYNSPTTEAHDTTFIMDPTLLPTTDITTTSFTAHWTYPDGTDSVLFQLSTDDFKTLAPGYQSVVAKSSSLSVTGLDPGTPYEYHVKRFKNGKVSGFSEEAEVNTVNIVLGTEQAASIEADVYPNPATQGIFIKLSERETNATATFLSAQGEYLMTVPLTNGTVNEVELRSLKPGVFILSISTASGSRRFKLVKA